MHWGRKGLCVQDYSKHRGVSMCPPVCWSPTVPCGGTIVHLLPFSFLVYYSVYLPHTAAQDFSQLQSLSVRMSALRNSIGMQREEVEERGSVKTFSSLQALSYLVSCGHARAPRHISLSFLLYFMPFLEDIWQLRNSQVLPAGCDLNPWEGISILHVSTPLGPRRFQKVSVRNARIFSKDKVVFVSW